MSHSAIRDVVALFAFLGYGIGAALVARPAAAGSRRRRASWFTAYVLAVSFAVGLSNRDMYPFTAWPLISEIVADSVELTRFAVVGADGREYDADARAWEPLPVDELWSWSEQRFPRLDSVQRDTVGAWLLARAEQSAGRARRGGFTGVSHRFLGPLAAPYFLLHPTPWDVATSVPPSPLRSVRIYRDSWFIEQRARDPSRVRRRLLFEYRRPS